MNLVRASKSERDRDTEQVNHLITFVYMFIDARVEETTVGRAPARRYAPVTHCAGVAFGASGARLLPTCRWAGYRFPLKHWDDETAREGSIAPIEVLAVGGGAPVALRRSLFAAHLGLHVDSTSFFSFVDLSLRVIASGHKNYLSTSGFDLFDQRLVPVSPFFR
jgi:hypothetical protein